MKPLQRTALASVINLILLGMSSAQAADTQALERRIKELESRLAKMDQLERRLEKLDQAGLLSTKPLALAAPAAPTPEVEKLNRKVNTLERKLEVQDEVNTGAFQKLPVFDVGENGFRITSSDKKHQVRIRGAIQADGHFFSEDGSQKSTDSFDLKQARIWLEGYVFKNIYYKLMPDFAAGGNILPDAYIDYAYDPAINLLVGKFKPSLSLERLQGDSDGTFLERAFPTYLASNRDVGIQVHGAFGKPGYSAESVPGPIDSRNFLTYQLAVENGAGDDGSPNNNAGATYDSKEFVGRVFSHPFQHTTPWLEGFGFGLAGSYGDSNTQALKNQATPIGRTTYLDYTKINSGYAAPTADGDRNRLYPQAYWYAGPFGLMGEYVTSNQQLSSTKSSKAVSIKQENTAWQVLASYVLTGEDNTFGAVKPIQNFDPFKGTWGAWQLAARWSELNVDKNTFTVIDPSKSANHATAWTLGVNWYLNSYALIRTDYEQVSFKGGAGSDANHVSNRPSEHVFATRFQLSF
jgi:phosphate-selective porin OprO and OprP